MKHRFSVPEEKPVRQAFRHSNQGILVSCQICLVHAMAEGKDGGGNHYCYILWHEIGKFELSLDGV